MNIAQIIKLHPSISQAEELQSVYKPLKRLGIDYFGHGRISKEGIATGFSSDPTYFTHYLQKKHFDLDLHTEVGFAKFGYLHWDFIKRGRDAQAYHETNLAFGLQHIFTIIRHDNDATNLYHFATNQYNESMNCFYLDNLFLLEHYIDYYIEQISINKTLANGFSIAIPVKKLETHHNLEHAKSIYLSEETKKLYLKDIGMEKGEWKTKLAKREFQCAQYLMEGLSAKEISARLHLSSRTVETYFERLKARFGSKNKIQLVKHLIDAGFS